MESAKLEADLMMVESVKKIAWIPDNDTPEDVFLQGHYTLVLQRKNGDLETLIPTNEWMGRSFNHEVLAAAQRAAYQRKESLVCIDSDDSKTMNSGYIHVEKDGITCSATDKRVVNRLKYIPKYSKNQDPIITINEKGKEIKEDREPIVVPHQWNGYCNATKENIRLTEEWVVANFQSGYLKQVMSATGEGTPYILVPPGDCRSNHPEIENNNPKIKYRQKEGEGTCMSLAMANAVSYLGERQIGHLIFSKSKKCEKNAWSFRQFCFYLRNNYKPLNNITFPEPSSVDLFGDIQHLHLVTVLGDDGKENHCVALTQQWIFDANFNKVLPRTRSSLDQSCSSNNEDTKFVGAVFVAVFKKMRG